VASKDLYASDDYNLGIFGKCFKKAMNSVFGKYILNPMNEVTISSSSNDISYINTGDYGFVNAEVEYRKQLLIPILTTLKTFAGLNASYIQ
jgi:hypothetical protein